MLWPASTGEVRPLCKDGVREFQGDTPRERNRLRVRDAIDPDGLGPDEAAEKEPEQAWRCPCGDYDVGTSLEDSQQHPEGRSNQIERLVPVSILHHKKLVARHVRGIGGVRGHVNRVASVEYRSQPHELLPMSAAGSNGQDPFLLHSMHRPFQRRITPNPKRAKVASPMPIAPRGASCRGACPCTARTSCDGRP